ncbi:MAG: hypothetical protein KDH88_09485 [Chromatiales bacterium]|nr:hypothetical protein [Chromatiales bacterium]
MSEAGKGGVKQALFSVVLLGVMMAYVWWSPLFPSDVAGGIEVVAAAANH